ncbi:hypothetical protein CDAR_102291, partial [Caerostris darwini]
APLPVRDANIPLEQLAKVLVVVLTKYRKRIRFRNQEKTEKDFWIHPGKGTFIDSKRETKSPCLSLSHLFKIKSRIANSFCSETPIAVFNPRLKSPQNWLFEECFRNARGMEQPFEHPLETGQLKCLIWENTC